MRLKRVSVWMDVFLGFQVVNNLQIKDQKASSSQWIGYEVDRSQTNRLPPLPDYWAYMVYPATKPSGKRHQMGHLFY